MRIHFMAAFITLFCLSGCLTQANQDQEADKIIGQFHQAIQQHQWDQAIKLYDPKFFREQSQAQWQQKIESTETSLGMIQGFKVVSKQKDPRFGGDFYIYVIAVQHERGFSHETITIFKSLDDKPLSIVGYKIRARSQQ